MLRILSIVGARPQFVKAAVVSRAIRHRADIVDVMVHTGQHYDDNMSEIFFRELDITTPKYNLGVGSASHGVQTGAMLASIENVLTSEQPDVVLIYGDTNSTLAGALAAAKAEIPVAHVEAGLRSFNRRMPEEINRVVADHVADLLLAPTEGAVNNLRSEGVAESRIRLVGDVMYDIALQTRGEIQQGADEMDKASYPSGTYILATIHRAENTSSDCNMRAIVEALVELSRDIPVVVPVHPRTRAQLECMLRSSERADGVRLIEPVGYRAMTLLEAGARLIITDSGGVQKEAFFHRVPCVTVRTETEWVELVDAGWNVLAPPSSGTDIVAAAITSLEMRDRAYPELYGDGRAAEHIVDELCQRFSVLSVPN